MVAIKMVLAGGLGPAAEVTRFPCARPRRWPSWEHPNIIPGPRDRPAPGSGPFFLAGVRRRRARWPTSCADTALEAGTEGPLGLLIPCGPALSHYAPHPQHHPPRPEAGQHPAHPLTGTPQGRPTFGPGQGAFGEGQRGPDAGRGGSSARLATWAPEQAAGGPAPPSVRPPAVLRPGRGPVTKLPHGAGRPSRPPQHGGTPFPPRASAKNPIPPAPPSNRSCRADAGNHLSESVSTSRPVNRYAQRPWRWPRTWSVSLPTKPIPARPPGRSCGGCGAGPRRHRAGPAKWRGAVLLTVAVLAGADAVGGCPGKLTRPPRPCCKQGQEELEQAATRLGPKEEAAGHYDRGPCGILRRHGRSTPSRRGGVRRSPRRPVPCTAARRALDQSRVWRVAPGNPASCSRTLDGGPDIRAAEDCRL